MATFLEDTFTDTNGDNLVTQHTGETGATWTAHTNFSGTAALIQNNRVYCTSTNKLFLGSGTPGDVNQTLLGYMHVITQGGAFTDIGLICRGSASANTFYTFTWHDNIANDPLRLYKNAATQLGSSIQMAAADGETYILRMITSNPTGSSVNIKCAVQRLSDSQWLVSNNTWQASEVNCIDQTDSSSANTGVGLSGIWLNNSTSTTGQHMDYIIGTDGTGGGGGGLSPMYRRKRRNYLLAR